MMKQDMRNYIQEQLDEWQLGRLHWVEGPTRSQSGDSEGQFIVVLKYRRPGSTDHFTDGNIRINLGYTRKGGYWNRRQIRVAIRREGREQRDAVQAHQVWKSSQKAITSGRNESGAFEL